MKNKDIEPNTVPWKWVTKGELEGTLWILKMYDDVVMVIRVPDQYEQQITHSDYDVIESMIPEGASDKYISQINMALKAVGLNELQIQLKAKDISPVGIKSGEVFGRF